MTLRSYIWGMRFLSLLFLAVLGAVIFYVDPQDSGSTGIILFYLSAFFAFSAIFNLALLFLRKKFLSEEEVAGSVGLNFRQGILLSVLAVGIILFQGFRILVWWDALFLVVAVFLAELFFLSRE